MSFFTDFLYTFCKINTDAIIDAQSSTDENYAASIARNYQGSGYDDWFLPSSGEIEAFAENWEYIRNIVSNSNYQMAQNWIAKVGSQCCLLWTSSGLITSCSCNALASSGSEVFSRAEEKQLLLTVLPIRAY